MSKKVAALLGCLLFLSLFARFFNFPHWFEFNYDQETLAWNIKSILVDHKPNLIGLETSVGQMFIGPYFHYLLAPFYALGRMNPQATIALCVLTVALTLVSFFYLGKAIFSPRLGLLAAFIYGFSVYLADFDRTIWPPLLIPLTSLWFFYGLWSYFQTYQTKHLFLVAVCLGLFVSLHFTAVFAFAIFFVSAIWLGGKKFWQRPQNFLVLAVVLLVFFVPLMIFDLRHDLTNVHHFFQFLLHGTTKSRFDAIILPLTGDEKLKALLTYLAKTINEFPDPVYPLLVLVSLGYLASLPLLFKSKNHLFYQISSLFLVIPFIFLFINKGPLLSYYLLLSYPILLLLLSRLLVRLPVAAAYALLIIFLLWNVPKLFRSDNQLSLQFKKQAVDFIAQNSQGESFKVDFIHKPGLKTGFGYLFWLDGKNLITDMTIPTKHVYKIVIPPNLLTNAPYEIVYGDYGVLKIY